MDVWGWAAAERLAQAEEAEGFTEADWAAPTPCEGWTVREVIAHLGTEGKLSLAMVVALAKARFDIDRFIADAAVSAGRSASTEELVGRLRAMAASRWLPPGVKPPGPLVDNIVHAWDIRTALGRPARPRPAERYVAALDYAVVAPGVFRGRRRARDLALRATDVGWRHGDGPEVRGPAESLLAALTGRQAALEALEGDGVRVLVERCGARTA